MWKAELLQSAYPGKTMRRRRLLTHYPLKSREFAAYQRIIWYIVHKTERFLVISLRRL